MPVTSHPRNAVIQTQLVDLSQLLTLQGLRVRKALPALLILLLLHFNMLTHPLLMTLTNITPKPLSKPVHHSITPRDSNQVHNYLLSPESASVKIPPRLTYEVQFCILKLSTQIIIAATSLFFLTLIYPFLILFNPCH